MIFSKFVRLRSDLREETLRAWFTSRVGSSKMRASCGRSEDDLLACWALVEVPPEVGAEGMDEEVVLVPPSPPNLTSSSSRTSTPSASSEGMLTG